MLKNALVKTFSYNVFQVGAGCYLVRSFVQKVLKPSDGMCDQKGSFVDDEKLRFDFSWSGALSAEQVCMSTVFSYFAIALTGRTVLLFGEASIVFILSLSNAWSPACVPRWQRWRTWSTRRSTTGCQSTLSSHPWNRQARGHSMGFT